jgi:hypothetical protein
MEIELVIVGSVVQQFETPALTIHVFVFAVSI